MRKRSDRTEIRRLRALLRRSGQAMVLVTAFEFGGSASRGLRMQSDLVKEIAQALAPARKPRRAQGAQGDER